MTDKTVSVGRLILNALGAFVFASVCLFLAFSEAMHLASMRSLGPNDPDEGKALWIAVVGISLCGLFGSIALISFIRTVKSLRRSPGE
jgi:hypothetical protein